MAWNEPGNNNNKDPWNNNKGGRDQGPPDLDEIYRDTMKKVRKAWGGNNGNSGSDDSGSLAGLWLLLIVAFGIWVYMGFVQVKEAEKGVVLRFGQYHSTIEPGLKWQPAFIDKVTTVDVQSIISLTASGIMLTKDENVVEVSMDIQYRISDPVAYMYNAVDPDASLNHATDAALRYVIGHTNMDDILTTGREVVRQETRVLLEETIEPYQMGLEVVDVNFLPARPPEQVKEAFDDAIAAQEDEEKFINEANAYAREREPQARGYVRRVEQEAEAYKQSAILKAKGEVARFEQLLPEYAAAPEVTRQRLYIETMQEVYSNTSKVMLDVDGGGNMIYLPLDKILEHQQRSQPQSTGPARNADGTFDFRNDTSNNSNSGPTSSGRTDRYNSNRYGGR